MNETIAVLLKRRSVRKFLPEQVADEQLHIIVETGLYAPSGGNHQFTRFLVVQNRTKLDEINAIIRREFAEREIIEGQYQNTAIIKAKQKEGHNFFFHGPTLIVAVAPRTHGNSMADSACALENMQIAAAALGLGACWINTPHWLTANRELRNYLEPLGLGENEDIFGSIVVGHPALPWPEPAARKAGRVVMIR